MSLMQYRIFFITVIILLFNGCRNNVPEAETGSPSAVKTIEVKPEKISIPVHSSGILSPGEEMRLSFKTGGIVSNISVKEGDEVKKGDVLAMLDLSEINAQVSLAGDGYEKALRDYNRAKNLYADTVATLEQLQDATTALNVAESKLKITQFNLSHSGIVAPDNGIILRQLVKTNEIVSSGYPVFLFGTRSTHWKVRTGLSDKDIVKINPGDSALVTVDAWPGVRFNAVIDLVGGMTNPMTGTCDVELIMEDKGYRLASGFIASVEIFPAIKETVILVPVGAIVEADGDTGYIYSLSDSLRVHKVKVNIVTIVGSKAAIKELPSATGKIVSEGAAYLHDGEYVKIMK
jgi:multidrug efflux system membrane fusion protein